MSPKHSKSKSKRTIVLVGGIDGSNWLSIASIIYFYFMLMTDSAGMELRRKYDWVLMPVANPDGYQYTKINRKWQKNVCPDGAKDGCEATYLDANFNYQWGVLRRSEEFDPGYPKYPGKFGSSAVETRSIQSMINNLNKNGQILALFNVNGFGRKWIIPFGDGKSAANIQRQQQVSDTTRTYMVHRIKSKGNNLRKWDIGKSFDFGDLQKTTGSLEDWVLGTTEIPYAFKVSLGNEWNPFDTPTKDIQVSGEELYQGIVGSVVAMRAGF